jgi:uncharacterized protein YhaN
MRLSGFILDSYGPFRHCVLDFDPQPGRLNLLVAPNGRGKSVIRRALGDFLFDIPERTPMGFLHGMQQMRLQGRIAVDGAERLLVRRKGRGNTLADGADSAVAPEEYRRLIGAADRALFEQLFALDTGLLRKGAGELLESEGRLGQVLFAGGGGLGQVKSLLESLIARRDDIGRADRRQRSKPLWAALDSLEQAGRDLRDAALRPEEWRALEKRVADAQEQLDRLRRERAGTEAELDRIRLVRAVRPWLAARRAARMLLEGAADVPRLDAASEKSWRDGLTAHAQALSAAEATARHLEAQGEAPEEGPRDDPVVAAAASIEALADLRGVAAQAARDLPPVVARLEASEEAMARLRHELGWDAAVVLPPAPAVRGAKQRLSARPALAEKAVLAAREEAEAGRRLAAVLAERDALPAPADVSVLTAMAAALRGQGDPGRRVEAARDRRREAEAALREALAAIPDRVFSAGDLDGTVAPSAAALSAAETRLSDASAARKAAQAELDRLDRGIRSAQAELVAIMREASLPDPDALAAARAERDRLWALVHRAAFGPAGDAPVLAEATPLPIAFDRALHFADLVADALVAHSAQVAQSATLRERLAALRAEHGIAAGTLAAADADLEKAQAGLAELAVAAGAGQAVLPAALRAFLAARQVAVDRRAALARAAGDEAELAESLTLSGCRLAVALGRGAPALADLPGLLAEADRAIEAARDHQSRARELGERLATLQHDAAARAAEADRARAALAAWEDGWRGAAPVLSRPDGEAAEATLAALDLIEALRAAQTAAAEDHARSTKMRDTIAGFAAAVVSLARRLAPDLMEAPPGEAAMALAGRLTQAREIAAREDTRRKALREAASAAMAAREQAEVASRHLAALRTALRAADDDEAEIQLRRAHEVASAEANLAHVELQLRQLGRGEPLAELERLAEETHESEEAFAQLTARAAALSGELESGTAEWRSAGEARDQAARSVDAPAAAARRESARAALAVAAEEALLLHAAACLLKAGLERQREATESGLVRRIGAVFAGLTCADHAGVAVEENDRAPKLVALERDGVGRKQIEELSEGTRDQLYLALRIVALEEYAAAGPALPFIADDVLQTFDDARTRANLEALLGLSWHVQVIAMTHHPHVAEIAAGLPVHVMRLPD